MARQKRKASEALDPILKAGKALKVGDLAEELISAIGGTAEFARLYAKELQDGTKPGSVARARMLDGILRLVTNASAQNKSMARTEDEMEDEELAEIARELLGRATPTSPTPPSGGD
jgi:hypothetical protein